VATDGRRRFDLSVVTPEGAAWEGEAEMVIVPGADGEIGVLARHAPLVALLKAGGVRIYLSREPMEDVVEFATGPGFFKVENDRAIALVDHAVKADDIDEEDAQRQLEEARAELELVDRGESIADRWQLEQRILHAENMLTVAGRM
jgi:F-type H+-transporting ATPase subunit epsilon